MPVGYGVEHWQDGRLDWFLMIQQTFQLLDMEAAGQIFENVEALMHCRLVTCFVARCDGKNCVMEFLHDSLDHDAAGSTGQTR